MLYVYSILDNVSQSWLTVSLFNNDDVAKRAFVDLLNSAGFNPHKGDYSIHCLGMFVNNLNKSAGAQVNPFASDDNYPYLVFDGADLAKEANNE